jgi:hypothetical protein
MYTAFIQMSGADFMCIPFDRKLHGNLHGMSMEDILVMEMQVARPQAFLPLPESTTPNPLSMFHSYLLENLRDDLQLNASYGTADAMHRRWIKRYRCCQLWM